MLCKNTNNIKTIIYYKTYCKILTKVIKMAKRQHFNKLNKRSVNKSKTMWNLVKTEMNTRVSNDKLPLTIKGKSMKNYHELANVFNEYFINPFPSLTLQSARDLKVPSPSKRSKAFLV